MLGDLFFEPLISSLIAIGLLTGEIFFSSIKYRKVDFSLWIELSFLILLTMVDLLTRESIIYKELFYSILLLVPFLIMKLLKKNFIILLINRYLSNIRINTFQRFEIERSTSFLIILLSINTLLLLCLQVITVLNGFLFPVKYFSFALFSFGFLLMYLDKYSRNKKFGKENWVPIVSEDGIYEGAAPRSIVHSKTFILHPVVHLHLIHEGQIYLQKRPLSKNIQPGKWDTAMGGHVDLGESIEQALHREAFEELGIYLKDEFFMKKYVWTSMVEKELVFTYLCFWDESIFPNEIELDGGRFWSISEINQNIINNIFTPNFLLEYEWLKDIIRAN